MYLQKFDFGPKYNRTFSQKRFAPTVRTLPKILVEISIINNNNNIRSYQRRLTDSIFNRFSTFRVVLGYFIHILVVRFRCELSAQNSVSDLVVKMVVKKRTGKKSNSKTEGEVLNLFNGMMSENLTNVSERRDNLLIFYSTNSKKAESPGLG